MNPVHNRPQKPIRIVLVVFGLALLTGLGFAWYTVSGMASSVFSTRTDSPTVTAFSDWVKLKLPASTRNWQAHAEGFQDWLVQARFELPVSDVPAFLVANRLQRLPGASRPQNVLKLPWFNPVHALEAYKLRPVSDEQVTTPSGFYPTVFLEPQKTGVVTVYIWAYTI
jgi:hypothetical protein